MQMISPRQLAEFSQKPTWNSSSTIDAESRPDEPYLVWEPMWIDATGFHLQQAPLRVCPGCGLSVLPAQQALLCESPSRRLYQAHSSCAADIYQFTEYTKTARNAKNHEVLPIYPFVVGCREHYMQVSLEHPISSVKFYTCFQKIFERERTLEFEVIDRSSSCLKPNCVVLPLREFKLCLKISSASSSEQANPLTVQFRINLNGEVDGIHTTRYYQNNMLFIAQFEIVGDARARQAIVEAMNFKYKRPFLQEEFILLRKISVEFGAYEDEDIGRRLSFGKYSDKSQTDSNSVDEGSNYNPMSPDKSKSDSSELPQQIEEPDNEFISQIKTQAGSKEFQKKVSSMRYEEIEKVIVQILPCLEEIVLNEYANYMFQSLLSACTFEQRMRIIVKVATMLTRLVCQQQGTFVFQQLISLLTNKQEFECLASPAAQDFYVISMDNYGNHFMRKLIQNIPREMLGLFMPAVYQNFQDFSKNKNAVCVMKCILRSLRDGEKASHELSHHLKKYLDCLTLGTQQLINDEFGNYLIQEAFDLVSAERLSGISEYIIKYFWKFSCEKYASNVVANCIKKYWQDPAPYHILKKTLDNRSISHMYQSREGNKVLLEIMELPLELALKDKIGTALRNEQASKFNNRRWVGIVGKSKTGAVGTPYNNFSEACSFTKKKHYN